MRSNTQQSGFRDQPVEVLAQWPLDDVVLSARGKTGSERLLLLEIEKFRNDVTVRKILVFGTAGFVVLQTAVMTWVVYSIALGPSGAALQPLMATLIAATLAESYFLMRIMVKYYFAVGQPPART